jgi:hypothetical protein
MTEVHDPLRRSSSLINKSMRDSSFSLMKTLRIAAANTKHKSHIEKIMFRAAGACPHMDPDTGEWWDDKIHLRPFINHPELLCHQVNKETYRDWMCNYVIHAIVAQWPSCHQEIRRSKTKPAPSDSNPISHGPARQWIPFSF